jgi:hypothetical protein
VVAEVSSGGDAIVEIVFIERFLKANGDGLEIAAGEAAVRWVTLSEDEQVLFLPGEDVIIGAKKTADVRHAIFLCGHGAAVAQREHFPGDLFGGFIGVTGLALLDEPGILCESARVKVERDVVLAADSGDGFGVFHRDRLAAARVVGDGEHDERDALAADAGDELVKRIHVHVAFEGENGFRLASFRVKQIDGLCADELDVGAGGVEVGVVGDDVSFFAHDIEQDPLSGAALVSGDNVGVGRDVFDRVLEAMEALAAGVAFVALHDGGPLMGGHGAGAGVGQEVDEDVVGFEQEEIVMCGTEELLALGTGGPVDRFYALDAERFDDSFGGHSVLILVMQREWATRAIRYLLRGEQQYPEETSGIRPHPTVLVPSSMKSISQTHLPSLSCPEEEGE